MSRKRRRDANRNRQRSEEPGLTRSADRMQQQGGRAKSDRPNDTASRSARPNAQTARTKAKPTGQHESQVVQLLYRYSFWIAALFLVVYLLSFVSRPLPDLTRPEEPEAKVFRFTLLSAMLSVPPSDWISAWTGKTGSLGELASRWPVLVGALAISAWAWILGRVSLLIVGLCQELTRLERFFLSLAIGWQLNSLLILAVGLLGQLQLIPMLVAKVVLLFVLLVAAWVRKRSSTSMTCPVPEVEARDAHQSLTGHRFERVFGRIALGIAVLCGLWILLGAMLPPVEFDVLEYHLQVPKEWYREGRIGFLPHNVYGNMPLGAEVHSIDGMIFSPLEPHWWWGALIGKTVMALMGCCTAGLLLAAGTRWWGSAVGRVSALLFLSTPWVVQAGFIGWNELAYGFYFFAAIYAWLRWREAIRRAEQSQGESMEKREGEAEGKRRHRPKMHRPVRLEWEWLCLSGFLAGAAVSVKYPALLFVVLPLLMLTLLWPWHRLIEQRIQSFFDEYQPQNIAAKPSWRSTVLAATLILTSALLSSGLWFAKNAVLTGNPTYPLLGSIFGGLPENLDERWSNAHRVKDESAWTLTAFIDDFDEAFAGSQWLSPLLVPFALLAWGSRRDPWRLYWLWMVVLLTVVLWWFLTHRIERFLIPVYPLLACLGGLAICCAVHWRWRMLLVGCFVLGTFYNLVLILAPMSTEHNSILGENRILATWEELKTPNMYREVVHREIDGRLSAGGKALLIGDATPFDLEAPVDYYTCFNPDRFQELTVNRTPTEVWEAFQNEGIRLVYVDWQEIARYRLAGSYGFSEYPQPARFEELVMGGALVPIKLTIPEQQGQLFQVAELPPTPDAVKAD